VSQAEELDFLNLEYFSVINLPDDWGFCHDYQVIIDFHLYNAVDRLDGYFLKLEQNGTLIKLLEVTFGIFLHGSFGKRLNL